MNLYLLGYMASGKTTFGRALSLQNGLRFIDLDHYIEESEGKTVSEIFRERGESGFREIERKSLKALSELQGVVIACGGGTPCFFDNIDIMNATGHTVFLEASPSVLISRLEAENESRPLVAGKSRQEIEAIVKKQLSARTPFYSRAKIRWNSDHLESVEEIKESIENFKKNYPFVFSTPFL